MWTGTESAKGDGIVLYNCGELIDWFVCGNMLFSVKVWRTVNLMLNGNESVTIYRIMLYICGNR
jgi:hypothetical protein